MSQPAHSRLKSHAARYSADPDPPPHLNPGVSQFIESMGLLMERYGLPRIGGRIMGLFMVYEQPLSLDNIARLLGVSRASVSTNLRMTEMLGLARRVARPGDRRDYYVGTEDMWMQSIKSSKQDSIVQMAEAARAALPLVPPDDQTARRQLQEILDFTDFFVEYLDRMLDDWEKFKARRQEPSS